MLTNRPSLYYIFTQIVLVFIVCVFAFPFFVNKYSLNTLIIAGSTVMGITLFSYLFLYFRSTNVINKRVEQIQNLRSKLIPDQPNLSMDIVSQAPVRPSCLEYFAKKDERMKNIIAGDNFRYADYSYNVYKRDKFNEYVAKTYYYSILELDLPRKLPNMLFDSIKAQGKQFKMIVDPSQKISLEGNFDNYFSTYFPVHYNIDSLSLISPEVMQALIQSSDYDIEIYGNKLYLFGPLKPVSTIPEMISLGKNIRQKLLNNAVRYRDERLSNNTGREVVSTYGIKLRENIWVGKGFIITGLILAAVGLLPTINSTKPTDHLFYGAILITIGIFKIGVQKYRYIQQDKNYHKKYS